MVETIRVAHLVSRFASAKSFGIRVADLPRSCGTLSPVARAGHLSCLAEAVAQRRARTVPRAASGGK